MVHLIDAVTGYLFGCHHHSLSRVFTIQHRTYQVCCDCGAEFEYSLTTMSKKPRLTLAARLGETQGAPDNRQALPSEPFVAVFRGRRSPFLNLPSFGRIE